MDFIVDEPTTDEWKLDTGSMVSIPAESGLGIQLNLEVIESPLGEKHFLD